MEIIFNWGFYRMTIDGNKFLESCILPIIALIFLEILWNLFGYSVAWLMWLLKFLILAWAGFRYHNATSGRGVRGYGRGVRAILDNPRDEGVEEKRYTT